MRHKTIRNRTGVTRASVFDSGFAFRRCSTVAPTPALKCVAMCTFLAWVIAPASADDHAALSLATVQPFCANAITVNGRVHATAVARLGSRINGRIEEFGKDAAGNMLDEGMSVKAGDVLFRIDGTVFRNSVSLAQAALKLAQASLDNLTAKTRPERLEQLRQSLAELDAHIVDRAREEVRFKRLVEDEKTLPVKRLEEVQTELAVFKAQRLIAQARLDEAENGPTATEIAVAQARVDEAATSLKAAQDDLRDTTVRAPYDGIITRRFKSQGDYATGAPQIEVIELTGTEKLEAELRMPEGYLNTVEPGKTPVALRSALLKAPLVAVVGRVVQNIDKSTGTFAIRVPIAPGTGLVNGAFVSADVAACGQDLGLIVPLRALQSAGGESFVFLASGERMVRCPVQVSEKLTESAVVKGALAPGQNVIVGPGELLKDGAPLPAYLIAAPASQPATTQATVK